jgi:broad specificity phosphatase PhoE
MDDPLTPFGRPDAVGVSDFLARQEFLARISRARLQHCQATVVAPAVEETSGVVASSARSRPRNQSPRGQLNGPTPAGAVHPPP